MYCHVGFWFVLYESRTNFGHMSEPNHIPIRYGARSVDHKMCWPGEWHIPVSRYLLSMVSNAPVMNITSDWRSLDSWSGISDVASIKLKWAFSLRYLFSLSFLRQCVTLHSSSHWLSSASQLMNRCLVAWSLLSQADVASGTWQKWFPFKVSKIIGLYFLRSLEVS